MNEPYVSTQISVLKTDRRLIAFYDKLKTADVTRYAQLHADGEYYENNRKARSLIGLRLLDYSNGTGDRTVSVYANVSPDTLEFIFTRLCAGVPEFSFYQDKIFGEQDQGGYSQVTRLSIIRATVTSNGQPRRIPWIISIDNGKGVAVKNPNGGSYMKKGSFQSNAKIEISLTDADMFHVLNRVVRYIHAWESAIAPNLIVSGKDALQNALSQRQNNGGAAYNGYTDSYVGNYDNSYSGNYSDNYGNGYDKGYNPDFNAA